MAWQPDGETLKQLVGYLKDALSGQDLNAQRQATMASYTPFNFPGQGGHLVQSQNM